MNAAAISKPHRDAALVAAACRRIEQAATPPALDALAREAGLSRHQFHRLFKAITGVTPKAYAKARRGKALRDALARPGARVVDAAFDAGFNASSRFYDSAEALLGMKPAQYRDGGADARIMFAIAQSALGALLVARSARGVCAISLGDDPEPLLRELQERFPRAQLVGGDAAFEQLVAQVVGFVEAPRIGLDLPLDIRGTAFQQRVWEALRKVPAGATVSYAEIAARIGSPGAVRAVAQACAANRLAVAIPCHRVVRSDGALSGYRWGIARRQQLLARERGAD
jgi:AraC family transcriptional regulator of adaptative response/methylated-DNA-[protein]-cysteine methyltransferase